MINIMASWFFSDTLAEIVKFLLTIDSIIYWIAAQLIAFAIDVASSEFVLYDVINAIIDRAYIIAGVFALFIMSYALIKGLFDPDGMFKGKNGVGSIVKNLVIAIALVALMPTIFQYMFRFQNIIVENNVIGTIILGNDGGSLIFKDKDGNSSNPITPESVGYKNYVKISANNMVFSALNCFVYADDNDEIIDLSPSFVTPGTFLTPFLNPGLGLSRAINKAIDSLRLGNDDETSFNAIKTEIVLSGNFLRLNLLSYNIATGGEHSTSGAHIHYIYIVSTVAGIAMLVLAFTFCVNLVVRMFNLFMLEVISPIASFSLIIPNSKIFDTWLKAVLKEYLDLFIRLATLNLAILIFSYFEELVNQAQSVKSSFNVLNILFVIGLLIFINEAPKLVKDIFGIKDDKKSIKDRLFSGTVAKTIGGALGLAAGGYAVGAGISHALRDTDPEIGKGKKAFNAIVGGARGFGVGKSASKSKNLNDFTGAVNKGMANTDAARQKSNLYYKQHGGNVGGVIAGKVEDAWSAFAGGSPTVAYEHYNEQENRLNDIKKSMDSLNEIADKSGVVKAKKAKRDKFESEIKGRAKFAEDLENSTANEIAGLRSNLSDSRDLYNKAAELVTQDNLELDSLNQKLLQTPDNQMFTKQSLQAQIANVESRKNAHVADANAKEALMNDYKNQIAAAESRVKDKDFIDLAYNNYLIDAQNELNRLDVDYKAERASFINSEAKNAGTDINLAVEKINRELIKEANAKNVFMSGVKLTDDIMGEAQVDKYIDDIKDKIFGKARLYNDKEQTYSIDYETGTVNTDALSALRSKYKDATPTIVIGERVAKRFDAASGKYVVEDAGIGELADVIAAKIDPTNYSSNKTAAKEDVRNNYNKSGEFKAIIDAIRSGFNDVASGKKSSMDDTRSVVQQEINNLHLDSKGITADDLIGTILKMNAGISTNGSSGNFGTIHTSEDYLNARRAAEEAYEQKKENK